MRNDLLVESEEFDHGIVGKIYYDEDPLNPRKEWDHAATMVCWHRRYSLGDEQPTCEPGDYFRNMVDDECPHCGGTGDEPGAEPEGDYDLVPNCTHCDGTGVVSDDEVMGLVEKAYYILPLFLYDHSGITMSTGSFSCPWDSGQVGWIYISIEKAASEGWKTPEQAYKAMQAEVEEYDHYLTGQCYGYVVEDADGEGVDSCWGFLGDSDYVRGEMRAAAMSAVEAANKEDAEAAYWAERDVITA